MLYFKHVKYLIPVWHPSGNILRAVCGFGVQENDHPAITRCERRD